MDPEACLQRAQAALEEGDLEECAEALRDYAAWRGKGGYAAQDGVARAAKMQASLREAKRLSGLADAVMLASRLAEITGRGIGEHLQEAAATLKGRPS